MNTNGEKFACKNNKKLASIKTGRDFILFLMSALRKTSVFSIFNSAYYFNPLDPSRNSGYVTIVGRKGISGIASETDINTPVKVDLFVDGQLINSTYAAQKTYYPIKYYGKYIGFYFPMKRVWDCISKKTKIRSYCWK